MPSQAKGGPGKTGKKLPTIPTKQQIKPRLIKNMLIGEIYLKSY